jgi:hypothetical protein
MKKSARLLLKIYGIVALVLTFIGFAGLFSKRFGLRIPIVSTSLVPALHRHAVWGETLRGRAILIGGEEWFFLIVLGLVILLGIFTAFLYQWIGSAEK